MIDMGWDAIALIVDIDDDGVGPDGGRESADRGEVINQLLEDRGEGLHNSLRRRRKSKMDLGEESREKIKEKNGQEGNL